ncbi:alpha/beta fold hydrolase [Sphingomonas sp. HITSZ_GF]|uniref:alpha/beta hydrolase family protein n=1 Tax=Sphingomonas sp. HITSZ_GF TaxID=3037247 RepID=UPI00240E6F33|nr:alpha/beta fold hydrolase [Sphingomonas sp. HITSZ_GF]MDG2532096.1 alpha/beta fold hydrolase [Sphingomonas sp. HITSZ_GF]
MQRWLKLAILSAGLILAPLIAPAMAQPAAITLAPGVVETPIKLGQGEWAVDAMLTMPAGSGPHPAFVLVPGSGPGSMDLNVGGSTIFRDIAWGLAARGVASIRFNKRPTQHAAAFKALGRKPTLDEEYIEDASSAAAYLRTAAGVDPKRIYVFGNSMGATLAATIANRNDLPGAFIMAGSPRRIGDVLIEQATYGLSIAKDDKERARAEQVIENGKRINAITPESDPKEVIHGSPVEVWRTLAAIQPVEQVRTLSARGGRVFIAHGDRDYLITESDWLAWQPVANLPGVTMRRFPKLNHIMQEGEGKMTFEEYRWTRPVSSEFIEAMAAWIKAAPAPGH